MSPPPPAPLLIFDGKCGFCRIWIEYWQQVTGGRVAFAPSQEVGGDYPQIPAEKFAQGVQLVRPDGSYVSNARAAFETLGWQGAYERVPLLGPAAEVAYGFIASHRNLFYWLTRIFFGLHVEPARFAATQWLFLKLLAAVYAIAFASLGVQVMGLLGSDGITPVAGYLASLGDGLGPERFLRLPTLFWLNASDTALAGACWLGLVCAVILLAGYAQRAMLAALYLLYLSLALAGQQFLLFQWDSLLLEAGFLAIFFGRSTGTQRTVAWLSRWLVFRLFFLSGWVKLASGDAAWHGLTALDYHYWTQPLPNVIAWYAARLPAWFQQVSTFAVLAIELGAPLLIFLGRRPRMLAGGLFLGLQTLIFATGNYTFFNILTATISLFLFDDQALRRVGLSVQMSSRGLLRRLSPVAAPPGPSPGRSLIAAGILTALILPLGLARLTRAVRLELPRPVEDFLGAVAPFQIVNSYGLFAVMTTSRPEIIVEGSADGDEWLPYEFRYKPGDLDRAPPFVAPHQPRLDWQMWFAALGSYRDNPWLVNFAVRLLEGSPAVTGLLARNPFPDAPPRYVRAELYEYRFAGDGAGESGRWWQREDRGPYLPAISLRQDPQPEP